VKQARRLSLPDAKIPIPRRTDGRVFISERTETTYFRQRGEQVAGNVQETSGWVLVFHIYAHSEDENSFLSY
jgi:hypothetical protein